MRLWRRSRVWRTGRYSSALRRCFLRRGSTCWWIGPSTISSRWEKGVCPLFVALIVGMPMMAAQLQVDHVTVAGRDLGTLRRALDSAGIANEYGGPHANHATEMALTSFPDGSYLELIAIQPQADPKAVAAN